MDAIKVENPNQLPYFSLIDDDCPLTQTEGKEIIEGVFVRSRIKPVPFIADNRIYLSVVLRCMEISGSVVVFNLDIQYGRYEPSPPVIFNHDSYGGIGSRPR
jgi:hypothetical protein